MTNLPLELLYKKKLEQKLREQMIRDGVIQADEEFKPSLGAA